MFAEPQPDPDQADSELNGSFSMQQNPYFYPVFPLVVAILLVALVLSYLVAALSWHLIERPFLEGFLSGRRKKKAAAPTS